MSIVNEFFNHVGQTSPKPLLVEVNKAEGCWIYNKDNEKYLDLNSGIAVSNIGHGNKHVIKAIENQVRDYMHTMVYGEHVQSPQVRLAKKLSNILGHGLDNVFFTTSGSEAAEGAMKLAKRATGRTQIIACKNAYHGSTHGTDSLISHSHFRRVFRPLLPDISFIDFNDIESLNNISEQTAAVFVEPIQGAGGVIPATNEFLVTLREVCNKHGALLVFDEIQTGMGRTGTWFAFQDYNVVPDIVLVAKAFGAGLPNGAFVANKSLMNTLTHDPMLGHINTFGGNPVCCAASLAGIEVLEKHPEWMHQEENASTIKSLEEHPAVRNVRGKGMMWAVETKKRNLGILVTRELLIRKVIVDCFLFDPHSFRIAPPLSITQDELIWGIEIIKEILDNYID